MAAESTARIGERIKDLREQRGMTQAALARALPGVVEASAVSRWERGKVRPRDETLEKLAETLGVDFAYFVAPEPETGATPDLLRALDQPGIATALVRIEEKLDTFLARLAEIEERADATAGDVSQLAADVLEMSLEQRARELGGPDAERPGARDAAPGGTSGTSGRRVRAR